MRTVRSAARARNQPHPGLALLVWVLAVLLLALTARLATASPAHPADLSAPAFDLDMLLACLEEDDDDDDDERSDALDLDALDLDACAPADLAGTGAEPDLGDDLAAGAVLSPLDGTELAINDDPIALEDLVLDDDARPDTVSVIANEQREALRRRQRSWLGRVDVSLGWRRRMAVRDMIDARNEVWLTATWRL